MFKTIARLIFGGEEEQQAPEDVQPRDEETEDEEWLVVGHDGGSQGGSLSSELQ